MDRESRWIEDSIQDLRYAARALRKTPVFTTAAALTIALGIGASTAIFSVTNAVLLRPLPYKNADRLVLTDTFLSSANFFDLRSGTAGAFDEMSSIMVYRAIMPRDDGSAEHISKGLVTTNFFRMLGGSIAFGRDFTAADAQAEAQPEPPFPPPQGAVAILSYEYWQRRYGGSTAVLGREMAGTALGKPGPRIVGVLAPGFKLFLPGSFDTEPSPDVWVANNRGYDAANRNLGMLQVIATLKDGVTQERAQAQVDRVVASWRIPDSHVGLELWHQALVAEVRPAILALMGAVIFLLLIACANVANLLLVRTSMRERELAVRAALGARRGRLTRQLLAEAVLLSGLGTLLGIGLAWLGLRELLAIVPENVPRIQLVAIEWRVLAFASVAGLAGAFLFGVLPGWRAVRPDVAQALRGAGPCPGRGAGLAGGRMLRNGVVITEVALSFGLLVGSGLMFRSFLELRRVDPGYDPHGLLTFLAVGDAQGFGQPERRLAFLRDVQDRLRAIPGVESVGGAASLPLGGIFMTAFPGLHWSTGSGQSNPLQRADVPYVLPGYFETLRTRLIEGRTFSENDNAPGRNVAIIDELLRAKAFANESAVGKRIFIDAPNPVALNVIGVVAHQRLGSLADPGREQIYVTDGFWGIGISRHWALRTAGDPAKYAAAARAAIASVAPGRMAVTEMRTMDATVDRAQAGTRFHLLLIGGFALIAALLASVGLYGVLSTAVEQRTTEIGVRMALGAGPGSIFKLVVGHGLLLSAAGGVIGLFAALGLTQAMSSMLVGIRPSDPSTFAGMSVVFLLIAAAASWIPARRAARLDPNAALRRE